MLEKLEILPKITAKRTLRVRLTVILGSVLVFLTLIFFLNFQVLKMSKTLIKITVKCMLNDSKISQLFLKLTISCHLSFFLIIFIF